MNRLITILLTGAVIASAQTPKTQNDFDDMAVQLQQKLSLALKQAEGEVEKACQAALEFQNQIKNMSEAQKTALIEQKRIMAQQQLETAIQSLEQVSVKVATQVDQAQEQIQSRLQEKSQELKQMQQRIRAKDGSGDGKNEAGTGN